MRTAFIAAAAALAAGCFGGLREPVPQPLIYRVDAPRIAAGSPLAADLRVAVTGSAPGLGGSGIASRLASFGGFPGCFHGYVTDLAAHWLASLDAQALGEMIFNNTNMMFTIFVKQEAMSVATLLARIRRQNRTLVQAIAA